MKANKTFTHTEPRAQEANAERRRIGRIVHDERGNGTVEWVDVTEKRGFERETLTLEDSLSIQQDAVDTFNPYERKPLDKPKDEPRPVKRDLRKLSEWIKATRAVEEKKARGED